MNYKRGKVIKWTKLLENSSMHHQRDVLDISREDKVITSYKIFKNFNTCIHESQ